MRKILLLCLFFCFFQSRLLATGDSLSYLNIQDTIFLDIGPYQEKVFNHFMAPKQTLYSLAKFYGLSLDELTYYNPTIAENVISVDQAIRVPIPDRAIIRFQSEEFIAAQHVPICYQVKKGDTMYKIAKRIFDMPIDTLIERNGLKGFSISPGQILQIGWMNIAGIPESFRRFRGHPVWKMNQSLRRKYNQDGQVKGEALERGVAFWQKNGPKNTDLYALHRKAPINSVISVTNPMMNRTVYVKVIGRLPDSVYGSNVAVVLSGRAAQMLGAKDARFFVKVRYLKP